MTQSIKPREQWTREEVVGFVLHTLAAAVDPGHARLSRLAHVIDADANTLSRWKAQGFVPWFRAKRINARFGDDLAPIDDLCPAEYRD